MYILELKFMSYIKEVIGKIVDIGYLIKLLEQRKVWN